MDVSRAPRRPGPASPATAEADVAVLRVLAHADRLAIVRLLADGDARSVTQLAEHIRKSVSAISHDLHLLRRHGVLDATKRGHHVWHTLHDARFATLADLAQAVTRPAELPKTVAKDAPPPLPAKVRATRKTRRTPPKKRVVRARR